MKIGVITSSVEYLTTIINVINTTNDNDTINDNDTTNDIIYIITNHPDVLTYCVVNLKPTLKILYIKTADNINDEFISILPKVDLQIIYSFYIIPKILYMHPKYKTINIHYSLLPSYRGPNPVLAQILRNEKYTGSYFDLLDAAEAPSGEASHKLKSIAEKLKAARISKEEKVPVFYGCKGFVSEIAAT